VHISQLADGFVSDPHTIVSSGQIVQVRVLEVDAARKRISLSMKTAGDSANTTADSKRPDRPSATKPQSNGHTDSSPVAGSLAAKLQAAGLGKPGR